MPSRCASEIPRARVSTSSARLPGRPGRAVQPPVQAAAVDIFQLEERQTVGHSDVVDLHDVGVLEAGDGLGLGQEKDDRLVVGIGTRQDHFQHTGAVQQEFPRLVDDSHATPTQLAQDLVALDCRQRPLLEG
jgi:hypothetical protein